MRAAPPTALSQLLEDHHLLLVTLLLANGERRLLEFTTAVGLGKMPRSNATRMHASVATSVRLTGPVSAPSFLTSSGDGSPSRGPG